jgi:hypothetical protein
MKAQPNKAPSTKQTNQSAHQRQVTKQVAGKQLALIQQFNSDPVQRATVDPSRLRPADVLTLQRVTGNQAVTRLLGRAAYAPRVQFKLMVGPAGDAYEQEADRVAEQVVGEQRTASSPAPAGEAGWGRIQRQEEKEVQTKSNLRPLTSDSHSSFEAGSDFESRLSAMRSGGSPLPDDVRGKMEVGFGADFSDVRVHADSPASALNHQIQAKAFTLGQHIYVGAGQYNLGSESGQRLLAHELTHVIQQGGASASRGATQRSIRGGEAGTIQRWDEKEHQSFGDEAATAVMKLAGKGSLGMTLGAKQKVSFGKAT